MMSFFGSRTLVAWLVVAGIGVFSLQAQAQQAAPRAGRPSAGRAAPKVARGARPSARPPANTEAATEEPASGEGNAVETPAAPRGPQAPFTLTPQEEAQLDKVLLAWQQRTQKIKKFRCGFTMWVKRGGAQVGGKNEPEQKKGEIYYSNPDRGSYEILEEGGDHWICDGRSVFIYNHPAKKVEENILPVELQGRSISEGPLPFLFGAEAEKQKRRYYMRVVTPPGAQQDGKIWIEAFPKFQADAGNFRRATVILDLKEMLPFALEIIDPTGSSKTAYQFEDVRVNELLPTGIWNNPYSPKVPKGYVKVVMNPAAPATPGDDGESRRESTGRVPALSPSRNK
ncbi:MAG: hypothetical protein AB7O62_10575 [Pirellulales bacterium]